MTETPQSSMPSAESVTTDRQGHSLVITINRPHKKNALNGDVAERIQAALTELDREDDLRVGIITGAAGFFSAGQDLDGFTRGDIARTDSGGFFGFLDNPPDKVLIAAIEGGAYGGGFELALGCDLLVASRDALFALPEVRRSLLPLAGGLTTLPRRLPYSIAAEMALTGEPKTAESLHARGLLNRVCEPGHALEAALELADRVSLNGPLAVRTARRIVRESLSAGPDLVAYQREQWERAGLPSTLDFDEAMTAFVEKRPPVWRNR